MSNWNSSELANISEDQFFENLEELVHVRRAPRVSTDDAARVVRNAGLTNQVPTRWSRW